MTECRLVLASASPRRRSLLGEAGFAPRVISTGVDDGVLAPGPVSPAAWTAALAYLKAAAGRAALPPGDRATVLGADTIVVKDGAIIGQPSDRAHAEAIIRALRGGSHTVMTGVALLGDGDRCIFVDASAVTVGHIADEEIERYLDSGGWRGKAGAYNLAERLDAGWPITYSGDPATVMGLPMRRLGPLLRRRGSVRG